MNIPHAFLAWSSAKALDNGYAGIWGLENVLLCGLVANLMSTQRRATFMTGSANGDNRDDDDEREDEEWEDPDYAGRPEPQDLRMNGTHYFDESNHESEALSPPVPYWAAKRHTSCGNPTPPPAYSTKPIPWRGAPTKLKTANAALVLCLNIDVDPPDTVKTKPCAVLEAWVDPHTLPSQKAMEAIATNLKLQFEGLSLKIMYKAIQDPSYDDLWRSCQNLRKNAKDDAVLFHYNGHGVPRPTDSGELWCFNRLYTQYIPVSLTELQSWLGSPAIYIWDCSGAGHLLTNFNIIAEKRDQDASTKHGGPVEGSQPFMASLQLAACASNEQLPTSPELPADLFTSCLTSPIDIALRYYIMHHQLPNNITADMVMHLPGDLKDRKTPLGELNWIFTAITDTIAWTTFSRDVFTRLYRCDLLIASLFRNFLLAERIMKNYHCTPHTYPPLPATNTHPLWATWDLAVDACLRQLPNLTPASNDPNPITPGTTMRAGRIGQGQNSRTGYNYVPSRFFADQLTAFEVWISRGGAALTKRGPMSLPASSEQYTGSDDGLNPLSETEPVQDSHLVPRKPPDQLPIVLQVLLCQPHRLRALILLSQFVDLGPWAVNLVLSIGIFPYISKLLQAAGPDLRPVLIFIWARILAVDPSVQTDLINNNGYRYFATILGSRDDQVALPNSSEHKAMCAFILASASRDFPMGQDACKNAWVFDHCLDRLEDPDYLLRQWSALCIAQIWDGHDENRAFGVDRLAHERFVTLLADDSVEVRCAALYALGTFMGASGALASKNKRGGGGSGSMTQLEDRIEHFKLELSIVTGAMLAIRDDASPMCRKEIIVVLSCLVKEYRGYFVVCAWLYWEEDRRKEHRDDDETLNGGTDYIISEWLDSFDPDEAAAQRVYLSSFFTMFITLLDLSVDPYSEVATNAQTVLDYIMALLIESPFAKLSTSTLFERPLTPDDARTTTSRKRVGSHASIASLSPSFAPAQPAAAPPPARPPLSRAETMTSTITNGVSNTIRRTSSFANVIKSFANGIAFPASPSVETHPHGHGHHQHHSLSEISPRSEPARPSVSRPPSPRLNLAKYSSPYAPQVFDEEEDNRSHRPLRSRDPSVTSFRQPQYAPQHQPLPQSSHHHQQQAAPADFTPWNVIEALVEEDMERLRARRRAGATGRRGHHGHHRGGPGGASPSSSMSSMDSNGSVILGLGTGVGMADVLPLRSTFFDWCCEYFTEPQMRQAEADEPGSIQFNYQMWRQQRNETVIEETARQVDLAEMRTWDRPVATMQVHGHPLTMAFHSFDKHLFVANESDVVSVWDWSHKRRISWFHNGNTTGTSITALEVINQDLGGIVVTGSSDGVVRLYRNYDPAVDDGSVQMVSAFRGLTEIVNIAQGGAGMVMDWQQQTGIMLVGGDSRIIKTWDAQTEVSLFDIDTESDSPVTSLVSRVTPGFPSTLFAAGFANGEIRLFDRRDPDSNSVVRHYHDHESWVQNVRPHPTKPSHFLSASLDGKVKLWDMRAAQEHPLQTWDMYQEGLAAFDVHPHAGVWAASSSLNHRNWRVQRVSVQPLHMQFGQITSVNLASGMGFPPARAFPSPYIPRMSALKFHPMEMLYGVGEPDGTVRIMGCGKL
ncbi:WD-REPEATS-REGION domain-containing protein [Mycena chlorophos]|uniref:WD-REPEATS-REGION domain-containing protein n=1 Tax=Mycena chlorophos TaxID=658473 RepID=A0A8H6SNB0_MYCCL|nr:WD-REPEATS-REGION domain-containing protein [Mycena chlorophos]